MSVSTTPNIVYKRATLTRYVVVIEDTKDMLIRVSFIMKSKIQNSLKKGGEIHYQG